MVGGYCRDKDSVGAAMLVAEMAAYYSTQGKTLADAMDELYAKYGYFSEHTYNLVMPGLDGLKDMAELMRKLREEPPAELSGVKIVTRKDYKDGTAIDATTGKVDSMELSGSNVLRFEMADGTSVIVRPSGTEPKVKVYVLAQGKDAAEAKANNERYGAWVKSLQK
jgi:phosphoglucomutase